MICSRRSQNGQRTDFAVFDNNWTIKVLMRIFFIFSLFFHFYFFRFVNMYYTFFRLMDTWTLPCDRGDLPGGPTGLHSVSKGVGWVVLRFRAVNPGIWYLHCHQQFHFMRGLAATFVVGKPEHMMVKMTFFSSLQIL